jgi:hypothetical protein
VRATIHPDIPMCPLVRSLAYAASPTAA